MARRIRPQAERYIGLRLALPDHSLSIFLFTAMEDPTTASNKDDATGFIRLNGLRLRVNSTVNGSKNLKAL